MLTYTLDVSEFTNLFDQYDRSENFTSAGRRALFEYLEDLSEETGEDMSVDIIALCCEWSEYTQDELIDNFNHLVDVSEYDDSDELYEAVLSEIRDNTMVVEVNQGIGREDTILLVDF